MVLFQLLLYIPETETEYGMSQCLGFFSTEQKAKEARDRYYATRNTPGEEENVCILPRCLQWETGSCPKEIAVPLLTLTEKTHVSDYTLYPALFPTPEDAQRYLADFRQKNRAFLMHSDMDMICEARCCKVDELWDCCDNQPPYDESERPIP